MHAGQTQTLWVPWVGFFSQILLKQTYDGAISAV